MTKSLQSIDNDIATLQALRLQMISDANAESKAALKAIPRGFEWRIQSAGLARYLIQCRFDAPTLAAFAAWREAYPHSTESIGHTRDRDDIAKWHGMIYIIARTSDGVPFIASTGGGSVVLNLGTHFSDPLEITEDQFRDFMEGCIPVELQKPW